MIVMLNEAAASGVAFYDDGVARASAVTPELYVIEAGGRSVQFDILSTADAANRLCRSVPLAAKSIVEAAHVLLEHVEAELPADG